MSRCSYCWHFLKETEEKLKLSIVAEQREKETGKCTFSPAWINVPGMHYCGQFTDRSRYSTHEFWESMHRNYQNSEKYKAEAKSANQKLKALRQKIREAK